MNRRRRGRVTHPAAVDGGPGQEECNSPMCFCE
jgi:hypothetical protein